MQNSSLTGQEKIYQMVTDSILAKLDAGVVPWDRGWSKYGGDLAMPINLISNKAYRGINVLLLGMQGYSNPYWLSFKQAKQCGGHVAKGEEGTVVVFWKWLKREFENEDGSKSEKSFPYLRYSKVWNVEQCVDLNHKRITELQEAQKKVEEGEEFDPIECLDKVWTGCMNKPEMRHGEDQAYYNPNRDFINMPKKSAFKSAPIYYSTLFHELAHSTGHEKRLARCDWGFFGSETYSKEELTAELTSAFLMGFCGHGDDTIDRSAAYIHGWSKKLREDRKMIVQAAQRAHKAADYILNIEREY